MPILNFGDDDDAALKEKYYTYETLNHTEGEDKAYEAAFQEGINVPSDKWLPIDNFLNRTFYINKTQGIPAFPYKQEISRREGPAVLGKLIKFPEVEASLNQFLQTRHYAPKELVTVNIDSIMYHGLPGCIAFHIECPPIGRPDGYEDDLITEIDLGDENEKNAYNRKVQEMNAKYRRIRNLYILLPRENPYADDLDKRKPKWPVMLEKTSDPLFTDFFKEWLNGALGMTFKSERINLGDNILDTLIEEAWYYAEKHDKHSRNAEYLQINWENTSTEKNENLDGINFSAKLADVSKLVKSGRKNSSNIPLLLPRLKEVVEANTGLRINSLMPTRVGVSGYLIDVTGKPKVKVLSYMLTGEEFTHEKELVEEFRFANFCKWLVNATSIVNVSFDKEGNKRTPLDTILDPIPL
ncbi:hypothetical protein E3Q22_03943 [Wallemia mellicola]|uniref:Uncharacterized protein n=1 Tax=Wallemia mellicola TaxID=1708541 RepID=A0A4T0LZC4_9BASI|nr:hypothetical protein E3Q22_03943 [Wallemia mellicola]